MTDKSTRIYTLIITSISSFFSTFILSSLNIALPDIQKEFSANAVVLIWISTGYILTSAVMLLPAGKMADIYGRKKIFLIGLIIFTVFNLSCAFATSTKMLIILRILQGPGGAFMMSTSMAIITSVFPVKERGSAIGINTASIYLGLSAGPLIGGFLTYYFGWRSLFYFVSPIGFVVILLVIFCLKGEWADAAGEKFDITGSCIYGLSLVLLICGATIILDRKSIIFITAGIIGFISFAMYETKIKNPVFNIILFIKNRLFAFSSIAALINYLATYSVTFLLSLYLQYIKNLPPQKAGLVLIAQPVLQAVFSPFTGRLSDRKQPAILSSLGMGLCAFGLFLLIFLHQGISLIYILIVLSVLGIGFALFSSPNTNAIMGSIEKKYYGIASGTLATMRTIGMTLSMTISAIIFSLFMNQKEITPAVYPEFSKSVKYSFIIFTILCVIGIYFSYTRGEVDRKK